MGSGAVVSGVIAVIAALRPFGAKSIDFASIETRTFLWLIQQVVSGRDVLKLLLGFGD